MNILQDLKQNEFHQNKAGTKNKKPQKSMNYELQMQIGTVYNQVLKMLEQNQCNFKLPQDGIKSAEKLELFQKTIQYMLLQNLATRAPNKNECQFNKNNLNQNLGQSNRKLNESNFISCLDCQNYEVNLQKLQNEVRQHIRLQQQLKIYQESMQQKIQEFKKEKTTYQKKIQDLKRKLQDTKHAASANNQKMHKLEYENQKMKAEIKNIHHHKPSANSHQNQNSHAFQNHSSNSSHNLENSKKFNRGLGYESKQNKIDWVPRQISLKKDHQKEQKDRTDRKSVQKRGDSSERWRMSTSNNTKSTRVIPNQKLIMQKNRQQRKKAIQSKFQYRR